MKKRSKFFSVIEIIVIALLILIIAGMLFLYFTFSETGTAAEIFGSTVYQTQAVNMQPAVPTGCAVIGKKSAVSSAKTQDVVLCRIDDKIVVARIVDILNEDGKNYYTMHFDTAPENDVHVITQSDIIAAGIKTWVFLGKLLTFARSTTGIMIVIILPSFIIIILQVIKIVNSKHTHEEAVSLADLEDIMRSDDYPEEAFLPIDKSTSTDKPDMSGKSDDLSFRSASDKISDDEKIPQPVSELMPEDGIIRTGTLADIFGEEAVNMPKAVDIFAEDEEFFSSQPSKTGFSLFDDDTYVKPEEKEQDVFEEPPAETPRDSRSVLASEFYGITEEVRSHQEERRIAEENALFEDTLEKKADSILDSISDEELTVPAEPSDEIPAEEITETSPETYEDTHTADTDASADASPFEYFNSIGDALNAAKGIRPEPEKAPEQPAEEIAEAPAADITPDEKDDLTTGISFELPEIPEMPVHETVPTAAEIVQDAVSDMPVRGERPEPPKQHVVKKRVVKRKKVSVDDLLSMIDSEEKKLS